VGAGFAGSGSASAAGSEPEPSLGWARAEDATVRTQTTTESARTSPVSQICEGRPATATTNRR